ncbi:carboxymuconolactone decarboxylase family protein [Endozoicomonas sp. 2B-B]
MKKLRTFLGSLWQILPEAGLASEYHPAVPGGPIPIPFIKSQKSLLKEDFPGRPANSPELDKPARSFISYIQGYSSLPMRDRALVALRSAYICNTRHLIPDIAQCALDTGLKASDVQMVSRGHLAPGWDNKQRLLLKTTEELYKEQIISPENWKELKKIYTPQQILDLVFCIASFHLCVHPN